MADQAIASGFTEKVKGNVAKFGQIGYVYGTTNTSAVLSNTANTLVSLPFGGVSTPRNHFCGTKIIAGFQVVVAYADVAATIVLQKSFDGTNWIDNTTISSDATPNVTGYKLATCDLTNTFAPFWRIAFNASGLNCGTSGTGKFIFCVPNPRVAALTG